MNKHTNWSRLAAGTLALSLLSGCGAEKAAPAAESKTVTLDPSNPVSLTVWRCDPHRPLDSQDLYR